MSDGVHADGGIRRPRISIVFADPGDELTTLGVLPSLSMAYQTDVASDDYEIVLLANADRHSVLASIIATLGVTTTLLAGDGASSWWARGIAAARGEAVFLVGDPGISSPMLLSTLFAVLDSSASPRIAVRTFVLDGHADGTLRPWLASRAWPTKGHALVEAATSDFMREPPFRWLDPIELPVNVLLSKSDAERELARGSRTKLADLFEGGERLQLVGEGFARPAVGATVEVEKTMGPDSVDPTLRYFGRIDLEGAARVRRPSPFVAKHTPRLSVVVVLHEMRREAPRTLQSLAPGHQQGVSPEQYEIIVVDNGSTAPLTESEVRVILPSAAYYVLDDAPPSPARAINFGVEQSTGEALAIMIDGACLSSPGVLSGGLLAFRTFPRPVVVTRYFFLGPGDQMDTIYAGYDRAEEDRLLASISWPDDGYRLFEIASPDAGGRGAIGWLTGWFESNCLFLPRNVFDELGGYDERFDLPGGGFLNLDILIRALGLVGTQPVQLLGEGVFHQVHGGVTTNVSRADLEARVRSYNEQYAALRGPLPARQPKSYYFMGRLPHPACRRKMLG